MSYRAGYVALIGKPNVGKSTLLNAVVGQKLAIVSDKPQTTRRRLLGIATMPEGQIVFIDTPGLHDAHTRLGKLMNESIRESLAGIDLVLVVVDGSKRPDDKDEAVAKLLAAAGILGGSMPVIVCMNKMDKLLPNDVIPNVEAYGRLFQTESYMMTSLIKERNIDKLVEMVLANLPEQEPLFEEDWITNEPMRNLAAEFIREEVLKRTRQELPHAVATLIEEWEEDPEGDLVRINASIIVEKESQKPIIIGQRGQMIKEIGTKARQEIESLIGKRVFLELFVKVRSEWRQNPRMLRDLEYTQ
ncbi:MAG: GTPase Era [Fimbriimonadaceae bacterium]|nr:GTPase Era [Fimbriimonadaceae bacterium]